jgi:PPK2 family polyphosphate:nucleotide phosphotransferase
MKIDPDDFRAKAGQKVNLHRWPTQVKPVYRSKEHYQELLATHIEELSALQALLYASNSHSVLVVLQAMDAAGKDGIIKHVMSGLNPQGCEVHSFKHPSAEELEHDFLWRAACRLPGRGRIGIFNRSYYEEVLIVRVHPQILRSEGVPEKPRRAQDIWKERYRSIVNWEDHLSRNGTRILKFFLHISKEEQRKRFLARIDEPDKNWKFSMADIEERKYWPQYMKAYQDCLGSTSTHQAPWYIVPADDKPNARLIISEAILRMLRSLRMSYPKADAERLRELRKIRTLLAK